MIKWYDVVSGYLGDNGLGTILSQLKYSFEGIIMLWYGSSVNASTTAIEDQTQG
jgi:hypothetical protein